MGCRSKLHRSVEGKTVPHYTLKGYSLITEPGIFVVVKVTFHTSFFLLRSTECGYCSFTFLGTATLRSVYLEQEVRRRKLAEAAEARMKAHEGRGLKNPEALKLRQKRIEELERKHQEEASQPEGGLRVRQC